VKREEAAAKMGFSAYGVSQNDDPVSQALRGLIDNAQTQEEQIALLWATLEKLSKGSAEMPQGAVKTTQFQSDRLNKLLE
jgi:serine O-acetyltransferase